MTDRELLELAARAAGLKVRWHDSGYYGPTMEIMESEAGGPPWNPLTDDGDALRLAVKLGLRIDTPKYLGFGSSSCGNQTVFQDGCPYAQTRRAIVRAAAEIGKDTP